MIFVAILLEARFFYNNLNNSFLLKPKSESESESIVVIKKTISKSNPFIPPNQYYSPPTGCPGLGC